MTESVHFNSRQLKFKPSDMSFEEWHLKLQKSYGLSELPSQLEGNLVVECYNGGTLVAVAWKGSGRCEWTSDPDARVALVWFNEEQWYCLLGATYPIRAMQTWKCGTAGCPPTCMEFEVTSAGLKISGARLCAADGTLEATAWCVSA